MTKAKYMALADFQTLWTNKIKPTLVTLGETSSTAYRGDRGKTAYDHSQSTHARTDANNSTVAYDGTNKKLTKTVNGTASDVVTALTMVADGMGLQLKPIDLPALSADYTFKKYDAMVIDGIIYRCTATTTTKPPFNFVFDDTTGNIVYETLNGVNVFVVDSNTLNTGWEALMDIRDRYYTELMRQSLQQSIDQGIGIAYGTCTTAGGTAAKTVTVPLFRLAVNRAVSILFTNGFTATSPTLNVNGTGAKPINYFGEAIAPNFVPDNTIVTMSYDGTNWNVISIRTLSGLQSGMVDLGLPSGLLWADKNIGAGSITDFGLYFQWGGTIGYTIEQASQVTTESYNASSAHSISADLSLSEDAARVKMGSPWRMPTKEEAQELIAYCSFETATINNVSGIKATGPNGNSIFFPEAGMITASGNYGEGGWIMLTSSLSSFEPSINAAAFANSAGATWGARFSISDCDRARGVVIRPVM